MSIYIMAMSDLGDTLMIRSLEVRMILLNKWLFLRTSSILSKEIQLLVFLPMKRILTILRYDLDWGSLASETLSALEESEFLMYFSISWRLEPDDMLLVIIMIPLFSTQMKSAIMLDLIALRARLILTMCKLESLMNSLAMLLLIGIITCFCERSLVVIEILSLALSFELLMTL